MKALLAAFVGAQEARLMKVGNVEAVARKVCQFGALLRNRATTNPRLWGPTATLFIHFCNTVTNISR